MTARAAWDSSFTQLFWNVTVLKVSGLPVWTLSEGQAGRCFSQIKEAQKRLWLPLLGLRCLQAIVRLMPFSWVLGPFSSVLSPALFQRGDQARKCAGGGMEVGVGGCLEKPAESWVTWAQPLRRDGPPYMGTASQKLLTHLSSYRFSFGRSWGRGCPGNW